MTRFATRCCVPLLALALISGCDNAPPEEPAAAPTPASIHDETPPVGPDSGEASLALNGDGNPVLTWIETLESGEPELRISVHERDGWTAPRTVARGGEWFVNWADFPSLGRNGRQWVTHWLTRSGESTYAYSIAVSTSADSGQSWSSPTVAHSDTQPAEHGFVSYYPEPDGGVGMAWLDGRATIDGQAMTLRTARVTPEGQMADETLLDDSVCDCCQTDAALTADGPVVVYRDRSDAEVRDIGIVRRIDGQWTAPARVAADEWTINACPVNGPAVAARGRDVAVAWFTGAQGPEVKLATSADAGATFSEPRVIDSRAPLGRVDATWLPDGRLALSYMEREGSEAVVRVGIFSDDGSVHFHDIGRTAAARSSGFPRLTVNDEGLWVAWRHVDADSARVRVSRLALTSGSQ